MLRHLKGTLSILITATVLPLGAQNFGEITGTVTDSTGAVITGAGVTVISTATNQVRRATTNETGNYSVPFLVPGLYDVRAESPGFKASTRKEVNLQVGAVARIDFNMEVGEISQQIEVSGGASLLTTETVALGTVIENKRIIDLPLNGRNYLQLVTLSPNVTTEGGAGGAGGLQGGARSSTSLSIAGQRLEFNRYTLDGVENTDPNFNSYIIQPSVDALQEFKVQTGVYSAEFGRGASQINVTTKAGSNQFHGVAYEFLRNSALDARQWLQSQGQKNPFRRNQYGFTLGGPVEIPKVFKGKDKLFFMSNFEELRDRTTTQTSASVATTAMRNGDFSGQGRILYDPLSRAYNANGIAVSATPFSGNVVPPARLNPVSLKLLEFYPAQTVPGNNLVRNFTRNAQAPTDSDQFNQRIDWIENSKSSWFGRFSWGSDLQLPAATFLTDSQRIATTVRQGMLSNTRILNTSTVNEARFAWNQFNNDLVGYFANTRDVEAGLAIPGLFAASPLAYGVPAIGLGGGISGFGGVTPWVTRDDTFQFMDNLSIVRGRHTIKIGAEIRRDRYNQFGNQKATGEFLFDGQATFDPANRNATGFIFADYMLGLPSQSARVVAMADALLRRSSYYGYIQDDWKITPKLTLNIGLRYENARPWHDKYRGIINVQLFDPGVGPNGILANTKVPILTRPGEGDFYQGLNFHFADGQLTQAGDQYMGRSLVDPDNNNFAPRIGLSYSPTSRWTIRAGAGVFYVQDSGNPVFDMARNQAGRDLFITNIEQRNASLSDPWAFERQTATCTGWSGACLGAPQILGNIQGMRTPYVDQWLFNIQREITKNLVLEAGYQGNEGHKVERFRVYNQPILKTGPTDSRTVVQRQPWPAFGRIQEVDGLDNSNYHALSAKLTQRFSKGLTYLIGFTWSKAIDGGSAIRTNSGDTLWPTNSYNLRAERGLSQFNVGRRFVASYVYELPFGAGKPLANQGVIAKIAGGWQLGGIVTLADGAPLNGSQLGDTAALNTLGNQPDATGISPIPSDRSVSKFWNIAAINVTSPELSWRPGNMGRNTLTKPGTRLGDLSLARNIRIHESHSLNVRFEAFNAANHPNWNSPSSDARSPSTFGVITSARTMRQLQFGLKYAF
ncbi:MAG: carboxypeptidase regulatory-like domain-containing protein [Acidobacteria bacterium]|nr:carboxypeptidase regulatory-like domain-containing protein [Acidobacteriota bacterium]